MKYLTKEEIQEERIKACEEKSKIDQEMIKLSAKKKQYDKLVDSLNNLESYYHHKNEYESRFEKKDNIDATPKTANKKVK